MPLSGGRASLIADLGGTTAKPTADVRAAVGGARYAQTDIGGDIGVTYDGATANIRRATLTFGGAYAAAAGVIAGLSLQHIAPRYALNARVEDADIATLARVAKNPAALPARHARRRRACGRRRFGARRQRCDPHSRRFAQRFEFSSGAGRRRRDGDCATGDKRPSHGRDNGACLRRERFASTPKRRAQCAPGRFGRLRRLLRRSRRAWPGAAASRLPSMRRRARLTRRPASRCANARYRRFDFGTISVAAQTVGTAVRLNAAVAGVNGRVAVDGTIDVPRNRPAA